MADTAADWKRRSESWEKLARCLDKENDELRRENEAWLKINGGSVGAKRVRLPAPDETPLTEPSPAAAPAEMCCGGTCVRAVCWIHGPQGARP